MDFADTSPVALVLSLVIGYLSGSVPYGLLLRHRSRRHRHLLALINES